MARKIWRYTMSVREFELWSQENMQGWRDSLVGCVEDEAREESYAKYIIYDRSENVVAKGDVKALPATTPEPILP